MASPVFVVRDGTQIDAVAHGLDELSAVVYAATMGWFEIRLRGLPRSVGWIAPADAGRFRSLRELLTDGLTHMTAAWDRRLFVSPNANGTTTVVAGEPAERPYNVTGPEWQSSFPAGDPSGVRVLEVQGDGNDLWLKVEVVDELCTAKPRTLATGWTPAVRADGYLNMWFYAGGC